MSYEKGQSYASCELCGKLTKRKQVVVQGEVRWECEECGAQVKSILFYVRKRDDPT
jgi:uncharacterized Zn finger protein